MSRRRTISRLMLLLVLAVIGYLLITLPTWVLVQYRWAREQGPVWGYLYLTVVGAGAALLAGSSGWIAIRLYGASRRKRLRRAQQGRNPSQMSLAQRQREVQENLAAVSELQNDPAVSDEMRQALTPLVRWIEEKQQHQRLEIVAFGTISSGKSSLLNALAGRDVFQTDVRGGTTLERSVIPWPGADQVVLVDTPGLGELDAETRQQVAADSAKDADLVLLVVDGPLRSSEYRLLGRLAEMEKRVVVCLNKEDWYTPKDRDTLLDQIRSQVGQFVHAEDIVAVRSCPTQRQRVRVLADGTEVRETVDVLPDIEPLANRLMRIVQRDGPDLLLANLLLQSRGLVDQAKQRVRQALDQRAWQIVDRYMWGAGGAAALSPLPVVDLAAGCAISTKMVLDLARVYHQDIDVEVAVNLLGQQGKTLLGVLGTSAATPVVAATIASLIKSVPGIGTIAGGLMQGLVQAVIARWIGAIFIQHFKNEMREPPGGLANLARREWERITSAAELRKLVQAARRKFHDAFPQQPSPHNGQS